LPAAVRTNAVGRDGALSRSRPGVPEATILGITTDHVVTHAYRRDTARDDMTAPIW
jgi:hypothetical protein